MVGLSSAYLVTIQCAYCDERWPIQCHKVARHHRCPYCGLYNGIEAAKKHGRWFESPGLRFEIGSDLMRVCPQCGYVWKPRTTRRASNIQCHQCEKAGRRCNFPAVYLDESGEVISCP